MTGALAPFSYLVLNIWHFISVQVTDFIQKQVLFIEWNLTKWQKPNSFMSKVNHIEKMDQYKRKHFIYFCSIPWDLVYNNRISFKAVFFIYLYRIVWKIITYIKLWLAQGATTLSKMTFSITTLSITTLSITTLSITTLSITINKMRHSAYRYFA